MECEQHIAGLSNGGRMKKLLMLLGVIALCSCVSENELTKQQRQHQQQVDEIVAGVLFSRDLDTLASYNVHKDGLVVIKFDKSVTKKVYTEVVAELRANKNLGGLRAEQGGVEVCPLQ
jgi:hypothetical protein